MAAFKHEDLLVWITLRRTDLQGAEDVGQFVQEIPIPGDRIKLKAIDETLLVKGRIFEEDVGIVVLVEDKHRESVPAQPAMSRSEMAHHACFVREFLRKGERSFLDESKLAALATRLEVCSGLINAPRPSGAPIPKGVALAEGCVVVGQGLVVDESYRMVVDARFVVERDLGGFSAHVEPPSLGYDEVTGVQRGTGIGDDPLEAARDAQIDLLQFVIDQICQGSRVA